MQAQNLLNEMAPPTLKRASFFKDMFASICKKSHAPLASEIDQTNGKIFPRKIVNFFTNIKEKIGRLFHKKEEVSADQAPLPASTHDENDREECSVMTKPAVLASKVKLNIFIIQCRALLLRRDHQKKMKMLKRDLLPVSPLDPQVYEKVNERVIAAEKILGTRLHHKLDASVAQLDHRTLKEIECCCFWLRKNAKSEARANPSILFNDATTTELIQDRDGAQLEYLGLAGYLKLFTCLELNNKIVATYLSYLLRSIPGGLLPPVIAELMCLVPSFVNGNPEKYRKTRYILSDVFSFFPNRAKAFLHISSLLCSINDNDPLELFQDLTANFALAGHSKSNSILSVFQIARSVSFISVYLQNPLQAIYPVIFNEIEQEIQNRPGGRGPIEAMQLDEDRYNLDPWRQTSSFEQPISDTSNTTDSDMNGSNSEPSSPFLTVATSQNEVENISSTVVLENEISSIECDIDSIARLSRDTSEETESDPRDIFVEEQSSLVVCDTDTITIDASDVFEKTSGEPGSPVDTIQSSAMSTPAVQIKLELDNVSLMDDAFFSSCVSSFPFLFNTVVTSDSTDSSAQASDEQISTSNEHPGMTAVNTIQSIMPAVQLDLELNSASFMNDASFLKYISNDSFLTLNGDDIVTSV